MEQQHIIDCDVIPKGLYVNNGIAEVGDHRSDRPLRWDKEAQKEALYLSSLQKGSYVRVKELLKELASKPVLNANVLDYLLAHTELIPEAWQFKRVLFPGTIYHGYYDTIWIRCLEMKNLSWRGGCYGYSPSHVDDMGKGFLNSPVALRGSEVS